MNGAPPILWILSPLPTRRRQASLYWLRDPLVGLARAASSFLPPILPTDWISNFAAALSPDGRRDNPAGDARARRAWQALRPEAADEVSTEAAMVRLWRGLARVLAELPVLERLWREGRIEVEGAEHLAAARAGGRPILIAALHLGNWEVNPLVLAKLGYPPSIVALVLDNRFENGLITRIRQRYGASIIPGARSQGRAIVKALQAGGPVVMHIDEFAGGRVQGPAFGRRPSRGNMAHAVRFAAMTGAVIIPAYGERLGDAAHFRSRFLPALQLTETGDALADRETDVARLNALVEPIVRAHLDQWFYGLDLDLDN